MNRTQEKIWNEAHLMALHLNAMVDQGHIIAFCGELLHQKLQIDDASKCLRINRVSKSGEFIDGSCIFDPEEEQILSSARRYMKESFAVYKRVEW